MSKLTKRETFNAIPDTHTGWRRGQTFEIIRMLTLAENEEINEETGLPTPMAQIRFTDGCETSAFPEEIWEEWSWS